MKKSTDGVGYLLDVFAAHFASRRDAVDVIGRFGNRFEEWVRWEAAVAIHIASFVDEGGGFRSVLVERNECDLFVGGNPWPKEGSPAPSAADVWIQLKARSTYDKGAGDLGADVARDLPKLQRLRKLHRKGRYLALAVVVEHPGKPAVEAWITKLTHSPHLASAKRVGVRRIYADGRELGTGDPLVLMALLAWEI